MTYSIAIQSTAENGIKGDFLYEKQSLKRISPIFNELIPLFKWCKENGFQVKNGTYDYYNLLKDCKNVY